jgi:hypothetical protein
MVSLMLLLAGEGPTTLDQQFNLHALSADHTFNFVTWTLEAWAHKLAYGTLAPQRLLDAESQSRFVLDYLDRVGEAQRLAWEIEQVYVDPDVEDAAAETAGMRADLAALREELEADAPIAEAILERQVGAVLGEEGFGLLRQTLPPVSGTFTPLPTILVVSPRDRIEALYQNPLLAGLNADERQVIEEEVELEEEGLSAYITNIGGLSAYPAMLLESASVDRVAEVMAHEWVHHYLLAAPLGREYLSSAETRTINETTASLTGEWAGQEVVRRFYAPLLDREKPLPQPLARAEEGEKEAQPEPDEGFDFREEMHHTRVVVDRLLEQGEIERAEAYMEAQRRYFVAQGYHLRQLNQAYFAFHGAYASQPGASGSEPIGPAVRQLWARFESPREFVRLIARTTTLEEVQALLDVEG